MSESVTVAISGGSTTVDADDLLLLREYVWRVTQHKGRGQRDVTLYVQRHPKPDEVNPTYYLHRMIVAAPPWMQVDHINGDTLDNRRCNLRLCTASQNSAGMRKRRAKSPYRGVYMSHTGKPWGAQIRANGRRVHLGLFDTAEEAAMAYDAAAVDVHGEFAVLNGPVIARRKEQG